MLELRPICSSPDRLKGWSASESIRDQAWGNRLEPERSAYRDDGYSPDRERPPRRPAAAAYAGHRDLRFGPRQPAASGKGDLRDSGAWGPGDRRARSGRV